MTVSEPSNIVTIVVGETSNQDIVTSPSIALNASPNPFKTNTQIQMKSSANSDIKLSVFNLKGQMLQSWTIKADAAGLATQNLDASTMDSGVYFYRMESAGKTVTGKLIRVK